MMTGNSDTIDRSPLDVRLRMASEETEILIPRNTPIPATTRRVLTTAHDNVTTIYLEVFQGLSKLAVRNKLLGKVWITGIKPAPKGHSSIHVTFSIDANGIFSISAEEGRRQLTVKLSAAAGLSKNDIDRMIKEEEQRRTEEAGARFERESGATETYYNILGVSRNATQDEIKRAYNEKSQKHHPDKFMDHEWAREKEQEIQKKLNQAYEVLGDPNKRKEYDKGL